LAAGATLAGAAGATLAGAAGLAALSAAFLGASTFLQTQALPSLQPHLQSALPQLLQQPTAAKATATRAMIILFIVLVLSYYQLIFEMHKLYQK
jgi:hypothetical protein